MAAPEGQGEGGTERPASSRIPPIATTPPRCGWKEELVSQSSSGTHVSNASGISLGEAIRHQSAINRDMGSWHQPYAETDTSNLIAALRRRLEQASGASVQMELPSMEGGPITPSDESRRQQALNLTHTPLLEVQDSCLSPNLPLLTTYSTQGRTFFNETLFQSLGTDFAPLRGTPDVSSVAHETSRPLQMNEAVQLAAQDVSCSSLSQHPFTLSTEAPSNTSPGSCLSQYPLSFSRLVPLEWRHDSGEQLSHFVAGTDALVSEDRSFQVLGTQKSLGQPLAATLPPEVPQGTVLSHDPFLLDSTVPAPLLLEMLEKEVGLSKHCGFLSSSESSSCKSALGKDPEGNETNWLAENMVQGQEEPEALAVSHREDGTTVPEQDSSPPFFNSVGKPFTNASLPGQLAAKPLQVASANKGHSMGDSHIVTGRLPRPLLDRQQRQQASEALTEESKQDRASAVASSRRNTPAPFQVMVSTELGNPGSKQVNAAVLGIQTGMNRKDLTLSGCSIEREHKYTGISPSFTEGSFLGYLAHPMNHSTPGFAPARALAQKAPGLAPPVQSVVQPPPLFRTDASTSSYGATCVPSVEKPRGPSLDDTLLTCAEEPPTLRSEQEAETRSSENLQALHPLQGRMQSLPSLNFMEKVGVWNMSQSVEKMSDALAFQSSSGVSPRQKAYSAVADSLNHILLKQQSQMKRQEGLVASFSATSTASLHALDKKSLSDFPLTRSRSENSVIAICQEVSRADTSTEIEQEEEFRPADAEDAISGAPVAKSNYAEAEDLQAQHYRAVLVSTVLSDEETVESDGGERDLKRFITSERVAELLREEAASRSSYREKSDSGWGDARALPCAHLSSSQLSMDHFSDVSPDSLNQINSSVASSCVDMRLSSRQPSVLSGESHSSLEDVLAFRSSAAKTPENREIDIEERIPVYLRNLGIDQSPSSILTPFLPRGPIREIEFSPSELRTMKASTDALRQCLQVSEGDSRSVVDISQSTLDSSTLSVPIPAGSDAGISASLPTDLSLKPSRDLPYQGDVEYHLGEPPAPTPRPPESIFELPAAPQPAESSQAASLVSTEERSTECVQVLAGRFHPKELGVGQENLSSASLPEEEEGQMGTREEPHSLHSFEEEVRDSFVASKTLKEIQELLAQTEARSPSQLIPVSSTSANLSSSLMRTKKADGWGDFRSIQENSSGLQRMWSWDETLTRQNVHEDIFRSKALSLTGSLKWEGMLAGDVTNNKQIVPEESGATSQGDGWKKSPVVPEESRTAFQEEGLTKSIERSEPEGCNSAAGARNPPLKPDLSKSTTGSDLCSSKESQAASAAEASSSISDILEGRQQILEKVGETGSKGTGSVHGSENSSSVDSLGVRVKNILRGEYPVIHAAQWAEGEDRVGHGQTQVDADPSLPSSRENASARESENSSSVDSLAARVKALLENERPAQHVAEILQRAEEEERRALMWVKLKLAAESSPNSLFDLNEEDRRKIEEIKTGLLLSGRKTEAQDGLRRTRYEGISSPFQKPEMGRSVVPNNTGLDTGIQTHNTHIAELPVQARPAYGTNWTLPRDSELKPLNSVQSYICTQLQTCTDKPVESSTNFHAHLGPDGGTVLRNASEAHAGEERSVSAAGSSPTEATKQITSITFASRKRSPPPPSASPVPSAGLPEAAPCVPVHVEAKAIGSEQLGPSRQLPDAPNPSTSASSTASHPRDNAGFAPGGDDPPRSLVVTGDESPQKKGTVLGESTLPTRPIEQKVHFVTENTEEEAVAGPQVSIGLRGNDRVLGGGHHEKVDPGGKMADCPLSTNLPRQTTDSDHLQDGFSGSLGSSGHDSSRLGDVDTGNGAQLPSPSLDHVSAVMPASPSSPTRKALSGVHITLSPKRISLDFPSLAETEMRQSDVSKTGSHPVTSSAPSLLVETTCKLKPSELHLQTQDSAYFPKAASFPGPSSSHLHSSEVANVAGRPSQEMLQNRKSSSFADLESTRGLGSGGQNQDRNFKVTVSSQTENLSSDAITQITTESPEKTTYSAEIFVSADNKESGAVWSPHRKSHEIRFPARPPALDQASVSDRLTGKPLLLPYKPPGSSEMYYVPCPKETLRLSRVRSETTMESSHSGSNDAIPPEFPAQALGSRDESPLNAVAIKHKEGIYSKMAAPKVAWTEEKADAQDHVPESAKPRSSLESVQATHSVFRTAQFYLHHPVPLQHEIDFHAGSEALELPVETERPGPFSRDVFQYKGTSERSRPLFSLHQPTGEQRFSPLVPEPDYSLIQEPTVMETCERHSPRKETQPDARKSGHPVAKELPLLGSQTADLPPRQTVHFTDSLDELWSKYLERRQQQRHPDGHKNELSLVERLDRLARLLQNPVRYSLMPSKDEKSQAQEKGKRREPKKTRSQGRTQGNKSNPACQVEESHEITDGSRLSKSRRHLAGDTKVAGTHQRTLKQSLNSETPSDASSEARPGKGPSALTDILTSESDVVTPEESTPPTEASGSISSIDTARLIRAFGHDRVRVSPKLSQLYSTISLQRSRSEKRPRGSRRAPGADPPKMARPEHKRKSTQVTYPVSSSDSVSTPGSSRGPSSALSNKRTARMLNKAVQAGDFEIVNSATKKHTRDVGLTFPTPTSSQTKLQGGRWNGAEDESTRPDRLLSGHKGKQKRQTSGWLAEKRTTRSKLKWLQGVSWFVSAEELRSDPKKETGSGTVPDPGPSWFEPLRGIKPWREPLREKNWPEDPGGLQVRLAASARDVENEPPPPYAKLSLQESLVLHRPDFISRSGERVKRLKLIVEERKLQSVLQNEREHLFNPPDERRAHRNGLVSSGGCGTLQRGRAISKNEMVQRSKRIYLQLPEVRKRREEEKRKSDYLAYRLKAQLYKTKITNRILGRKVPWE